MSVRTCARPLAVVGAAALVAGPLAQGAQAAPKRKPPTPVITSAPASPTNATAATFAFTNTQAGVTFECSVDGTTFATCTSPKTYGGAFADGPHSFKVRAKDSAGVLSNPATAAWTVDTVAPAAPSLSGVPASPTTATGASLAFTTAETGATFRCALDGAAPAACASPVTLADLADGGHVFTVAVTDAAGNTGPVATGTWTVDTTPPPAPQVTTGPASPTNATVASFQVFSPDAAATLECALDGAAYAACPDPVAYAALAEGPHTFDVRALDALGNAAVAAPRYAWTVDLTAPTPPAILTGPPAQTKDAVAQFTFNGFDADHLACSVDGGEYATCPATFSTAALADGAHTLHVRGEDAAGNASGATPYSWTVDNTPPPAADISGPPALTNATTATFGISNAEQVVTFTCALDGGAAAACADGVSYSSLAHGPHTLVVTSADALGNTTDASHSWTVDTVAPTLALSAPVLVTSPAVVTFSEPVAGVSAASLALRLSGTTAALAGTLACADAGGAAVGCAAGPVSKATLQPAAALVPGERYTVAGNPAAASTITDLAGTELAAVAKPFRAQTALQETTPAARYTWRVVATSAAYGGSYRTEHLAGAAASYAFSGTSVTWYTVKGRGQGMADVYVDGVKKATVNNYASAASYKVARTVSGLAAGPHVLKVVVLGKKGSTSGTGASVAVDAVKVGTTLSASPALTQTWRSSAATGPSGGAMAVADLAGQEVSLRFRGTSVSWATSTGRNRGIAKVYVDGVLKMTTDLYAATTTYGVRRTVSGLTDARHTVRIVVTGTKRSTATGTYVPVDRFIVG